MRLEREVPYDPDSGRITWRVHLASSRESIFASLTTDSGRSAFWAESAAEVDGIIQFCFPNGMEWSGTILEQRYPERFSVEYFGNRVDFLLNEDDAGGTDLTLIDHGEPDDERLETLAGWVSVLMNLKAVVDHGVDLRNHDPSRSWDHGYADN